MDPDDASVIIWDMYNNLSSLSNLRPIRTHNLHSYKVVLYENKLQKCFLRSLTTYKVINIKFFQISRCSPSGSFWHRIFVDLASHLQIWTHGSKKSVFYPTRFTHSSLCGLPLGREVDQNLCFLLSSSFGVRQVSIYSLDSYIRQTLPLCRHEIHHCSSVWEENTCAQKLS